MMPKPSFEPSSGSTRRRGNGEQVISFYEKSRKLYPRSTKGRFENWRWLMVWLTQSLFYGLCWLPWNGRQAVLFDLAERRFYIFDLVLWPKDVFYLTVLLILSAYALFFFTAIAGRLWCGFACPQTVYSKIFLWIEEKIEGSPRRRKRLDAEPWTPNKIGRKALKYSVWAVLSFWTGLTFVAYFTPAGNLLREVFSFSAAGWSLFWVLFYAAFTYLFAGIMREQVCKYMCPYARFQGVMFDPDTLIIAYDTQRGEPRDKLAKNKKTGQGGDCIDCKICVQVCPTGIDIRDGLQYECIGCAACIDACDRVMDKIGKPRGLIRYSTENAVREHWSWGEIFAHVLRLRTYIYGGILVLVLAVFAYALAVRSNVGLDIIRDREILANEVSDGRISNIYQLQIMNMTESGKKVHITVGGLADLQIDGDNRFSLAPLAIRSVSVSLLVPPEAAKPGAHQIYFDLYTSSEDGRSEEHIREQSTFIMPE